MLRRPSMPIDVSIATEYWSAVAGNEADLPELDDDPITAFQALLDAGAEAGVPGSFRRVARDVDDVYPGIAVLDEPHKEMELWAIDIVGLIPFTSSVLKDYVMYLDSVPDANGSHRVYSFIDGAPAEDIASIDEALQWMTAVMLYSQKRCDRALLEQVEESMSVASEWEWSGAELFCMLRDMPLPAAYQAWSLRTWPSYELQTTQGVDTEGPGASRIAMLAAVETVLRTRALDTRTVRSSRMSPAHKVLLGHLRQLIKAVAGGRPPNLVVDAGSSDDPRLVERSAAWLARFKAAEATADVELAPPPPSETSALREAVLEAVVSLAQSEQIEIEDDSRDRIADELSLAAFEAHNPRHALKKLRIALIKSDHVIEVYAADHELEEAFRRAMGG